MAQPANEEVNSAILDALSIANEQGLRAGFVVNTDRGCVVGTVFPNDGATKQPPVLPQAVKDGAVGTSLAIQKALQALSFQSSKDIVASKKNVPAAPASEADATLSSVIQQFNTDQSRQRATLSDGSVAAPAQAPSSEEPSTVCDIDSGYLVRVPAPVALRPDLLRQTMTQMRARRENSANRFPVLKSPVLDMRPSPQPTEQKLSRQETRDSLLQMMQEKMKALPNQKQLNARATIASAGNSAQVAAMSSMSSSVSLAPGGPRAPQNTSFSSNGGRSSQGMLPISRSCSPSPARAMQHARSSLPVSASGEPSQLQQRAVSAQREQFAKFPAPELILPKPIVKIEASNSSANLFGCSLPTRSSSLVAPAAPPTPRSSSLVAAAPPSLVPSRASSTQRLTSGIVNSGSRASVGTCTRLVAAPAIGAANRTVSPANFASRVESLARTSSLSFNGPTARLGLTSPASFGTLSTGTRPPCSPGPGSRQTSVSEPRIQGPGGSYYCPGPPCSPGFPAPEGISSTNTRASTCTNPPLAPIAPLATQSAVSQLRLLRGQM